jgi:hypothetical protein
VRTLRFTLTEFSYGVSILLFLFGLWAIVYESNFTVSAGGLLILVAMFLEIFVRLTDKIVELNALVPPPVSAPLEESKKVPTKTRKEIRKLQKVIDKLPPPPAPEWAKFTAAFMTSISKLWGELKLLIVGAFFFYLFVMETPWDWNGVNVSSFEYLRYIALVLGTLAVYRWITNNARWEPKPLSGGRWVALIVVSVVVSIAVVLVFAIIYLPWIIQLMYYLGIPYKGA